MEERRNPPEIDPRVDPEAAVALTKEHRKAQRARQFDLDVRGLLALAALFGALGLSFTELALGHTAELPQWATTMVGAVLGFYFGARSGGPSSGNGNGKH